MRTYRPKIGEVFWLGGTGSNQGRPGDSHRFVCVAVCSQTGDIIAVPICSTTPKSDRTCLIGNQDYVPLKNPSYAAYYKMREISEKQMDVFVLGNQIKVQRRVSNELFARICAGIESTDEATPKVVERFKKITAK